MRPSLGWVYVCSTGFLGQFVAMSYVEQGFGTTLISCEQWEVHKELVLRNQPKVHKSDRSGQVYLVVGSTNRELKRKHPQTLVTSRTACVLPRNEETPPSWNQCWHF